MLSDIFRKLIKSVLIKLRTWLIFVRLNKRYPYCGNAIFAIIIFSDLLSDRAISSIELSKNRLSKPLSILLFLAIVFSFHIIRYNVPCGTLFFLYFSLFFAAFFFSLLAISFARFSYAFEPFAFLS